jgi:hypothetical protein
LPGSYRNHLQGVLGLLGQRTTSLAQKTDVPGASADTTQGRKWHDAHAQRFAPYWAEQRRQVEVHLAARRSIEAARARALTRSLDLAQRRAEAVRFVAASTNREDDGLSIATHSTCQLPLQLARDVERGLESTVEHAASQAGHDEQTMDLRHDEHHDQDKHEQAYVDKATPSPARRPADRLSSPRPYGVLGSTASG